MAPIDLTSWRRQNNAPVEGKPPKATGDNQGTAGGNPNAGSSAPPSSGNPKPLPRPTSSREAAEGDSKPESPGPSTSAENLETPTRSIAASRPTTTEEVEESTERPQPPVKSPTNKPTVVEPPIEDATPPKPTAPPTTTSSVVEGITSSRSTPRTSKGNDATRNSDVGDIPTTSIAAPLTTRAVRPPQPSPPTTTIEPEPVPISSANSEGNAPVAVTSTLEPRPTPTPPADGGPQGPSTPVPPPVRPSPSPGNGQGTISSAIVPLPSSSPPPAPPANGGPGNEPPISPSPSPTAPAPGSVSPPALPLPSLTATAPPIDGGQGNESSPVGPSPSVIAPAPPASNGPGSGPSSAAPPLATPPVPPVGDGQGGVSSVVVSPPSATASAPQPDNQTSVSVPVPTASTVPVGGVSPPSLPGGGNGAAPGSTQVVPAPTITPISQASEAAPPVVDARTTLDINKGPADPQTTALPTSGIAVGAAAESSDGVLLTESLTTNTITSVSVSTFTSGNQVFTTSQTFLSTQTLSTRVPVPTGPGVAGIGDSGNSNKTKAAVGGGIGAAIFILIVAFVIWIVLRRRRRREQDLRSFLSTTPEPFFSPPSHSASPPPLASGSSLVSSSPDTSTYGTSTMPSYLNTAVNPVMTQKRASQDQGSLITTTRKKPVPFLDFPLSRPQSIVSTDSSLASSSLSLNPVHDHPMGLTSEDPFADPGRGLLRNPFDDPTTGTKAPGVPTLVVSPATPVTDKRLFNNNPGADYGSGSDVGHKELGFAY